MISKQQIDHIAHLSRLGLSEKEKEKFSKDLSAILDYVKKLDELEVKKIEPQKNGGAARLKNIMREDKKRSIEQGTRDKILKNIPEKKDGYVKVKAVL